MTLEKIDIELWKEIQDSFSEKLGIPIFSFTDKGEEIYVSGNIPFYLELIRKKKPELLDGRNGIKFIRKPLMLHAEKFGEILVPVGFDSEFDFEGISYKLSLDQDELKDASVSIKNIEDVNLYENTISIFAEMIPKLAYQTQKKEREITELKTLYKIIKKVNSTLKLDDVLNYIMDFLVNTLNATDCSVFVYDEEGERKFCLKEEVQKMSEIEKTVSKKAIEEEKPIIVKDIKQKFNLDVLDNYNAMLCIPLKLKEKIIGTISLYDSSINLNENNLEFISVIADQVAIALSNAQKFEQVEELAVIDKLTNVFNRRKFLEQLEKIVEKGMTNENSVSLILLDIDNFGKYNNAYGHPKGDELLKEVAELIKENVRGEDIVGRYGGEEFIILLPRANPSQSLAVAERIRKAIEEKEKVTVSMGLVSCKANVSSKELIKEADEAMYKAKNTGRNKIIQKAILSNNLKTEI